MALAAAFLMMFVCSSVLAAATLVGGLERRAAAAYAAGAGLRYAAEGAVAAVAGELEQRAWDPVLAGAPSDLWVPVGQGFSPASFSPADLTAIVTRETVAASAHGADTPVWRPFTGVAWSDLSGISDNADGPDGIDVLVWVADDWQEQDGNPTIDSNDLILVRAAAVRGQALNWSEGVFRRNSDGSVRVVFQRTW